MSGALAAVVALVVALVAAPVVAAAALAAAADCSLIDSMSMVDQYWTKEEEPGSDACVRVEEWQCCHPKYQPVVLVFAQSPPTATDRCTAVFWTRVPELPCLVAVASRNSFTDTPTQQQQSI